VPKPIPKPPAPAGTPAKPGAAPAAGGAAKPPAAGAGGAAKPPAATGGTPTKQPIKKTPASVKKVVAPPIDSGSRKLGQVLVDLGFIDDAQLEQLIEEARTTDSPLERVALNSGLVNEDQLLQAVAEQNGMRIVNLDEAKPTAEAIKMVQKPMAEMYKMLPLRYENDILTVVMTDPNNLQALDDIRNFLGIMKVEACLAPPKKIEEAIGKAYSTEQEETLGQLIASMENDETLGKVRRETSIDLDELEELTNAAPVRKLINMVLLMGIRDHASDIHFEPFEDEYKMRYRCDGVLLEMVPPPRHLAMAIASRIKVMANLDIAERRLPQDGRIELNIGGNSIDMRVSVLPTMFGESVVIRVLDRTVVSLDLNKIGMEPEMLADFRSLIAKPNGITLVTGPTGAGKTTTLYSGLNELNQITDKLITTEDPVEYEIDGIIQCQINSDIELTFASALRAILRQDPDKVLVGEIRDLETAQIAIQAALTGHMVFSTLHTNDAPSTITRLRDMGVEPYLITATVEGILAQRLVRKICNVCKKPYEPSRDQLMELNLKPEQVVGKKFYYGEGCDRCNNLGFKGRGGIFELLMFNDNLRDLISKGASTDQLRQFARANGVRNLREMGLRALYNGFTTIDEVVRETILEDEA
jgi:type IV pilus assembly protein PilB